MDKLFRALNDPTRRKILERLRVKPMTAGEISEGFAFSKPTISHHLDLLKQADLISERRNRAIARPRQAAMWLAKQLTTRSLPDIGRRFGGRDHTTVLHAVRRIEALKAGDAQLARDLETLTRKLRG